MLALGAAFALFFGGINAVGRRRLSLAHSKGSVEEESRATMDTVASAALSMCVTGCTVALIASLTASDSSLIFVALIPIIAAFANTFDNLRAAYNQHYVTAIFQTLTQLLVFAGAIYFGIPNGSSIGSALVLNMPFILASVLTFVALIWEKPYLLSYKRPHLAETLRSAAYVILADGALFSALNASLYALGSAGAIAAAAWYGTLLRVFQTLLTPVLLIMVPLTSYISIRWSGWNGYSRRKALNIIFLAATVYGGAVTAFFVGGGDLYLRTFFPSLPRSVPLHLAALGFFFGAIVAQKIYVQFVYSVDEGRMVSLGIAFAVCFGITGGAVSHIWLDPLQSLSFFCVCTAAPIVLVIFLDQIARRNASVPDVKVVG